MRFAGKVCLVSGGDSGIGKAAGQQFAREGGKVAIASRNEQRGQQAVQEIVQAGGEAIYARCDVGVAEDVRAAVMTAVHRWGRIDVLVNNAGMMTFKPVAELPEEEFDRVLQVNLRSVFLFCKYALPHMPGGSAMVNVSSVHAHATGPNVTSYAAAKGGMEAFIRSFAQEIAPQQIRVNCVAPGAIDTPMLWDNENVKSGAEKLTGAIGKPEDVAAAICFLAAPEARFINGTTLVVDGGRLGILP